MQKRILIQSQCLRHFSRRTACRWAQQTVRSPCPTSLLRLQCRKHRDLPSRLVASLISCSFPRRRPAEIFWTRNAPSSWFPRRWPTNRRWRPWKPPMPFQTLSRLESQWQPIWHFPRWPTWTGEPSGLPWKVLGVSATRCTCWDSCLRWCLAPARRYRTRRISRVTEQELGLAAHQCQPLGKLLRSSRRTLSRLQLLPQEVP